MVGRTLVAAAVLAAALAATPSASAEPPPTGTAAAKSVTLVTGDRVSVDGGRITFTAGPGRTKVRYITEGTKDDWTLIPLDVAGDVARGVLDRNLFRIPQLIKDGLGGKELPLIVQYRQGAAPMTALSGARSLAAINSLATAGARWAQLGQDRSVQKVWLDAPVKATLDRSVPQIGAPEAWRAGLTGEGVKVAVLDTGVDDRHPDLAGRVDAAANFSESADAVDRDGHGTHVASTIAGQGVAGTPGRKGVAPGVRLLNGKVLDDGGGGYTSDIIEGIEWAAQQGAKIVNMSLGAPDQEGLDPLEQAVERYSAERDILFVIAAGNEGPRAGSLGSPGSTDAALTVGAVDSADKLADFSSRGPRAGDFALKPDLTAPGVTIAAAKAGTGEHVRMSGTSMATPHVAGAAAILAQQHPGWTSRELKAALIGSAKTGSSVWESGTGRLDVAKAVRQSVTADAGTVAFGRLRWPYEDKPIVRTLTYRNAGTAPVTLNLALEATDAAGKAAPQGVFALSAAQVTVPAGGTAPVTVTAAPSAASTTAYGGRITASAEGVTLSTLVSFAKEPESYDLHVKLIDQLGTVPDDAEDFMPMTLMPESGGPLIQMGINHGDSEGPIRVPAGRYLAYTVMRTQFPDGHSELGVVPITGLEVKADREVVFDARTAKMMEVATDRPDAKTAGEEFVLFQKRQDGQEWAAGFSIDRFSLPRNVSPDPLRFRVAPTAAKTPGFRFEKFTQLAAQGSDGTFADSPYVYNLLLRKDGLVPGELRMRDRELGKVRADLATLRAGATGAPGAGPAEGGLRGEGYAGWSQVVTALPLTQTWYFTPGIPWERTFETMPNGRMHQTMEYADARTYRAGRQERERWNSAVVGTALRESTLVTRTDAAIKVGNLPLWHVAGADRVTGSSEYGTGTTTLLRDGKVVATAGKVPNFTVTLPVAPGSGRFQLRVEGTADPVATELSAKVTTEWSFTSAGAGPVPLFVLRAEPELDLNNATRPGLMALPLRLERMQGATKPITKVTAEFSADGRSWHRAAVVPAGRDSWRALLLNLPHTGGSVSLRLTARDSAGATVSQTVERAFRVR
ncbi:S8 family peptidase [Nonomuraea typhae]|uniref:S8 family peptidase n=1 Tax=Nonomuraea typhae TaxID=2603600 RepID=UPI0015E1D274|nr:S8 family serine peptidase [Nonomuraea typhae]